MRKPRGPAITLRGKRLVLDLPWLGSALVLAVVTGWFVPELFEHEPTLLLRIFGLGLFTLSLPIGLFVLEFGRSPSTLATGAIEPRRLYPFGSVSTGYQLPADPGTEFRSHVRAPVAPLLLASLPALIGLLPGASGLVVTSANGLALVLAALAMMNTLPAMPFAGGEVFRAIFWYLHDDYRVGTRVAFLYSQLTASGSLGFGIFFLIWRPDTVIPGLWCLFLGWMVIRASRSELMRAHLIARASTIRAADAVAGLNPTIRAAAPLAEAIDILLEQHQNGPALVRDRNVYVGMLNLDIARTIPRGIWTETTAQEAVTYFDELLDSASGATLLSALHIQSQQPGSTVVVRDDHDRICGLIDETMDPSMLLRRGLARNVRTAAEERSSREGTGSS